MMKKRNHLSILLLFLLVSPSYSHAGQYVGTSATPIYDVQLEYSLESKTLHVTANHVTSRPEKNFVRKLVITLNSKDKQEYYYSKQDLPSKFAQDIIFEAKTGDHIDVELWGSLGGKAQGSLDVTDTEKTDLDKAKSQ